MKYVMEARRSPKKGAMHECHESNTQGGAEGEANYFNELWADSPKRVIVIHCYENGKHIRDLVVFDGTKQEPVKRKRRKRRWEQLDLFQTMADHFKEMSGK